MLTHGAEFVVIVLATIILFIGVGACCIAAVRGGNTRRILSWFGILSAMYGVRLFAEVPAAFSLLVGSFWHIAPQLVWIIIYLLPIPALFSWAELSLGTLRRLFRIMVFPASVIAVAGISAVLLHKPPDRFMPCFRMGSKFRCIRSTPTEMQSISENDFECFASTGVNTPETMIPN